MLILRRVPLCDAAGGGDCNAVRINQAWGAGEVGGRGAQLKGGGGGGLYRHGMLGAQSEQAGARETPRATQAPE